MKRVKSNWSDVVLVCRKCSKKVHGGFGEDGDEKLSKVLKKAIAEQAHVHGKMAKGRRAPVGVIEVGCLDICPKNAVVTIRASEPRSWQVVPRGLPVEEVMDRLGLEPQPAAPSISVKIAPISLAPRRA